MNKAKFYGFLCIVLLLSNGFLLYFVLQPPNRPEGPKKLIIEKLHLDEKQTAAYEKLIHEHRNSIKKTEKQIGQLKQKLYSGLSSENTAETDSLVGLLGKKQMQIEKIHCEHFRDIKELCRPDQQIYFGGLSKELARLFDHRPPHHRK
ncbi:MAG: hypothetical protein K0R65_2663 [Crocinitomicaceae bacterium]|jgi:hypothetical protein|nr:hypothetical protein [Crocinitomicaceae bacterium]